MKPYKALTGFSTLHHLCSFRTIIMFRQSYNYNYRTTYILPLNLFELIFLLVLIILNWQATLIDPCIKGTLNVLSSCAKARVKRVVLTSSCSSIRYRYDTQQVSPLNESHWSDPDYCKHYNVTHFKSFHVKFSNACTYCHAYKIINRFCIKAHSFVLMHSGVNKFLFAYSFGMLMQRQQRRKRRGESPRRAEWIWWRCSRLSWLVLC